MGCLSNVSEGVALQTPPHPTSPSTFNCFARLAPDIRLMIWRLTVLEPRILELELLGHGRWHSPTPSSSIVPSIRHTCYESRQEGLATYERLSFGAWINFSMDTIYVRLYQNYSQADITLGEEFLELLQATPMHRRSVSSPCGPIRGTNIYTHITDTWY